MVVIVAIVKALKFSNMVRNGDNDDLVFIVQGFLLRMTRQCASTPVIVPVKTDVRSLFPVGFANDTP